MTTEPTKETPMSDEVNEVTQALEPCAAGWIVSNSPGTKWRTWEGGMPDWTDDREKATRYARRIDAEHVHTEDEDSWRIEPYVIDPRTAASQASAGEGLRVLKGWLDWYRFATGDDDCEYLNDKGWDDAEALASTTMGVLAALTTPVEASQPVGDAGEGRWYDDVSLDHALRSALRFAASRSAITAKDERAILAAFATLSPPTSDERLREALMGVLAALTTPVEASQPVGDVGEVEAADVRGILAGYLPPTSDERLREAAQRALKILERNLHRQTEKCDDAVNILRAALNEGAA